MLQNVTN